jgi:3-methyladenine DNA glycosylase/8-oxoguanine DNA glycosylase
MTRTDRILARVRNIPAGRVSTFADIDPAAPRLVGRVLAAHHVDVPWHRVIRADGTAPMGASQLDLLRQENVAVIGDRVDLDRARATPDPAAPAKPPTATLAGAINAVAARDPVLARLAAAVGPIRHRPRDPDGRFGALVRAIVYQQLAGRAAVAIHTRVRALVPGPLLPEALNAVPDTDLRAAGLSTAKLAALRDLSAKVLDGAVVLRGDARLSDQQIIDRLVTVRGVGEWTAQMYLLFERRRLSALT